MQERDFVRRYPRLFHLAAEGAWPSIKQHGLLSTSALLHRWEAIDEPGRFSRPRDSSRVIEHPEFGTAVLRDQKTIHVPSLAIALGEMKVEDWLAELDSRVFFFVHPDQVANLMASPSYRASTHTVLTIDTRSFLADHANEIEVTQMNTGFARPHNAKPRSRSTFVPLRDFAHVDRDISQRAKPWDISELCVRGAVLDIRQHVIRVESVRRIE